MSQQETGKQLDQQVLQKSSTGLEANLAALLSYLFGIITGVIFFALEKDSKFVKFHAMQSILISAALFLLNIVLGFIPVIGWIVGVIIAPLSFILWIFLMVQAYKGKWYKLPILGDTAEKQLKN